MKEKRKETEVVEDKGRKISKFWFDSLLPKRTEWLIHLEAHRQGRYSKHFSKSSHRSPTGVILRLLEESQSSSDVNLND